MDDILGEESDNESEGRGKEKPGNEEVEDEDGQQQQPKAGQIAGGVPGPQAPRLEERIQKQSNETSLPGSVPR